ncbi:MAG TPA: GAF domain-containing protein [Caldithrix sp.]|nr:GAF domain-containing protein [Calditrichaceae bacterium]HEM48903.1 GAF domain-containing protein [Caldithrix sp.]HES59612.1 GAF domain-containing protein [Caldithrix sp.]
MKHSTEHNHNLIIPDHVLENWQEIANILAELIDVPAALIMRYLNPDIEVFVASQSKDNPYHPGESETLFGSGLYCETVIKSKNKLLVPDARSDPDWAKNPDIKLNMISYLGFPILLPDKNPFGTLCVLDNQHNEYSDVKEKLMLQFRNLIESHLSMIYMNQTLDETNKELTDYIAELQALRGLVPICSNCKNIRDTENNWHPIEHYLFRNPKAEFSHSICPKCKAKLYSSFDE